jgi:hypothetical protein
VSSDSSQGGNGSELQQEMGKFEMTTEPENGANDGNDEKKVGEIKLCWFYSITYN